MATKTEQLLPKQDTQGHPIKPFDPDAYLLSKGIAPQNTLPTSVDGALKSSGVSDTKTEIRVTQVPSLKIETPTDIIAVLSFIVTAIVVGATTWMTIRNYQKTVDLQGRIAEKDAELQKTKTRVDVLSKNRQDWINTLRNTLADYISAALGLSQLKELPNMDRNQLSITAGAMVDWNYKIQSATAEIIRLKSKIALLANPDEDDFKSLLEIVEAIKDAVEMNLLQLPSLCDSLVAVGQKILKNEWEKVKRVE